MKKTLSILFLLAATTAGIAQEQNNFRVEVGYVNTRRVSERTSAGIPMHGGQIGLFYAHPIARMLYVEGGVTAFYAGHDKSWSYSEKSEDSYAVLYSNYSTSANAKSMTIGVPVNVGLRLALADGISLQPYAGLALNIGILGRDKYLSTKDSHSFSEAGRSVTVSPYSSTYISEMDWYDADVPKRCRFGGQGGLLLRLHDWSLSYQYQCDATRMESIGKSRIRTSSVSVGYFF